MSGRGEQSFVNLPRFAASLYGSLMTIKAVKTQSREIARDLVSSVDSGRLLDVGTGPGKLLLDIHKLNPEIELFGLDISKSMLQLAEKNLAEIKVDLRWENIQKTDYDSNFFNVVTCTGSFYLWDHPVECLDEIYRLLKENCSAYLYESYKDCNKEDYKRALKNNLKNESPSRRLIAPYYLDRQLKMSYRTDEFTAIIARSRFKPSFTIDKIVLAGLPIWLRIKLTKTA